MKNFIIWLDSKNAHIFNMKTTGFEKTIVNKRTQDHHTRHKNDKHKDSNSGRYYSELADKLKEADQLLILGPGLAKNHFKDHLKVHKSNSLAKKIIGTEPMESFEHKTEKQMMAKARKFFKMYDLFNN